MSNITEYFKSGELALAAYANLSMGMPREIMGSESIIEQILILNTIES